MATTCELQFYRLSSKCNPSGHALKLVIIATLVFDDVPFDPLPNRLDKKEVIDDLNLVS